MAAFLIFSIHQMPQARAASYDFYVDAGASTDGEDGSADHPFVTVQKAIARAMENGKSNRRIFLSNGIYNEHVVLGESVQLTGESKEGAIIEGGDMQDVVTMQDGSVISTLTLSNARKGVVVAKNSKATVQNCRVRDMSEVGIEISASSKSSQKSAVMNSQIWSGEKGIYVTERANVEIAGNDIYDNKQEGIDIRPRAKGSVHGNDVHNNKESGIEIIVGKSSVKIKNNNLHGNGASGIAFQYYKQYSSKGSISFTGNEMKNNSNFDIACKVIWGRLSEDSDYFDDSTKRKSNSVDGDNSVDPVCNFKSI